MGGDPFSSHAPRGNELASLFDWSPLSAGSSPSPLLLGKATKKTRTARRNVVVRFICTPFTPFFRMKCARASSSNDRTEVERGEARRPSLEDLLRMEVLSLSCPENEESPHDTVSCCLNEHAIVVFGITSDPKSTMDEDQEPLSRSKRHGAVITDDERQTAIVSVNVVDLGLKVAPSAGGSSTASPSVPISASLPRAILQALRIEMGRTKGRYRKLAGSRGAVKAELFYQRPIPLGRRCRVQHLEESPYV
ncbi:hypothetical protein QOZ80_2AG0119280 [Eleusine coracana subsp. coracana]|nr:hypothetical protein QOZ80_2AG0119280 [Eleusine coracana subsp. coracana]